VRQFRYFFVQSSTVALALLASACPASNNNNPPADAASGVDGPTGPVTNGTWTVVSPMSSASTMAGDVTGLYFSSMTNGVVAFDSGLVDHFSGPMTIDAVALDGNNQLPGPANDAYFGFTETPLGLVVIGASAKELILSTDNGKTFTYGSMYGSATSGTTGIGLAEPAYTLNVDGSGVWHIADEDAGVWASASAPSGSASFALTWHPDGDITVPATIPNGDCASFTGNSYYSDRPGPIFAANGSNMVYGANGEGDGPPTICHSTDGGKTFKDVGSNVSPSSFSSEEYPWIYLYTSATNVIAAFGSELEGASTTFALYSTDGGTSWTQATLPPSAANMTTLIGAFATPTASSIFLVGDGYGLYPGENDNGDPALLLYKSTDGGKTWTDLSAKLALTGIPLRISNGFALDDNNIWIGGEGGFIAYTSTGGQ
jgi:hypothetical protein